MLCIGLDVHCKWITVAGLDDVTGEIIERDRVGNDPDSLGELFGGLRGPLHGAMESGLNSWAIYRRGQLSADTLLVQGSLPFRVFPSDCAVSRLSLPGGQLTAMF